MRTMLCWNVVRSCKTLRRARNASMMNSNGLKCRSKPEWATRRGWPTATSYWRPGKRTPPAASMRGVQSRASRSVRTVYTLQRNASLSFEINRPFERRWNDDHPSPQSRRQRRTSTPSREMKPKDRVAYLLDLKKAAIQKLIPPHLNPERLLKVAQIAATTTPKLVECD